MKSHRLRYVIRVPPTSVFEAWTQADRLRQWFVPMADITILDARVMATEGGNYAIELKNSQGLLGTIQGQYLEVSRPDHLRFTCCLVWQGDEVAQDAPVVDVRFVDRGGVTEIVLTHEGIRDDAQLLEIQQAWQACFSRLPSALGEELSVFFARTNKGPHFQSGFGGFWPDFDNAQQRLAGKRELGWLRDDEHEWFEHWIEKGYLVLPQAVSETTMNRLTQDLDRAWQAKDVQLEMELAHNEDQPFVPMAEQYRALPHKVLDFHGYSAAARDAIFAPNILRFLTKLFERPPMAFQSLLFTHGTEQDMHQDTAYVLCSSPREFVGCWIALEDVQPGSGELQYYEGSHRIPEFLFAGHSRSKPHDGPEEQQFLRWVEEQSQALGLPLTKFRPRRGDAVLWHADLVHGGSRRQQSDLTRLSLVTHLCPVDVQPEWFATTQHGGPKKHSPGCYYCYPSARVRRVQS